MSKNPEQILIIHSVKGTSETDLSDSEEAIRGFSKRNPDVRVEPKVFSIPAGALPGRSLGTELKEELTSSIGAVVFVDDLRPNVAYELGFFHGQGRRVLLLTRKSIDSTWSSISDLAGAALVSLISSNLTVAVHNYLQSLYDDVSLVRTWPTLPLPSEGTNLLKNLRTSIDGEEFQDDGPYGSLLTIRSWKEVDYSIGCNLFPGAKFLLLIRAQAPGADYTVYFRIRFPDRRGAYRSVWLGLTSRKRAIGLSYAERTFPAQAATDEWRVITGEFDQLLGHGYILGANPCDYLEKIRFRAGRKGDDLPAPIEIGYLSIIGVDQ